jgi:hypothetical protein
MGFKGEMMKLNKKLGCRKDQKHEKVVGPHRKA